MTFSIKRLRTALAALALATLFAGTAAADPVLQSVSTEIKKGRRLDISVEADLDAPGEIRLEGTINGKEVSFRRRIRKASSRRLRFKIDPKKFKLKKLTEAVNFDVKVVVDQGENGGMVERPVVETLPVPCIVLPGFGNELGPDGVDLFVPALNVAAGGAYTVDGKRPNLYVHEYDSLTEALPKLGRDLHKAAKKLMKKSLFAQVDVIGYSEGGLIAREWSAKKGAGKVRNMIFVATPNEGIPAAQLVGLVLDLGALGPDSTVPGLDGLGGAAEVLGTILDGIADGTVERDALRTLYPSYEWAFVTIDVPFFGEQRFAVTAELLDQFGGLLPQLDGINLDLTSPLTALNRIDPDPRTNYHVLAYSALVDDALPDGIGTIDEFDFTPLLSGTLPDVTTIADGDGDGLVPFRSATMLDTPNWASRLNVTDLGGGTHITILADPQAILAIRDILAQ